MRTADAAILLVDDDGDVREVTATLLEEAGYHVLQAGSGGAGLELLDSGAGFDLLLVDFAMPGMNGAELARLAVQRRPGLPVLFVTGYADIDALAAAGEARVIRKPFQVQELVARVRAALEQVPAVASMRLSDEAATDRAESVPERTN